MRRPRRRQPDARCSRKALARGSPGWRLRSCNAFVRAADATPPRGRLGKSGREAGERRRTAAFSARACSNGSQLAILSALLRRVGGTLAPVGWDRSRLVAVLRWIAATLPDRCRARVSVVGVGRCRSSDDDRKRRVRRCSWGSSRCSEIAKQRMAWDVEIETSSGTPASSTSRGPRSRALKGTSPDPRPGLDHLSGAEPAERPQIRRFREIADEPATAYWAEAIA